MKGSSGRGGLRRRRFPRLGLPGIGGLGLGRCPGFDCGDVSERFAVVAWAVHPPGQGLGSVLDMRRCIRAGIGGSAVVHNGLEFAFLNGEKNLLEQFVSGY